MILINDRDINSVDDVGKLIDDELARIVKDIERIAFSCSAEVDKQRTTLIGQRDLLIALKVAIRK